MITSGRTYVDATVYFSSIGNNCTGVHTGLTPVSYGAHGFNERQLQWLTIWTHNKNACERSSIYEFMSLLDCSMGPSMLCTGELAAILFMGDRTHLSRVYSD